MSLGSQIIYKQLLQRHKRILIPMIQRDYAQGRPTEREVREEFLNALEEALRKPANDPTLPLNLDFVYGSVEGDSATRFLPLDGQQRLTTLFLLHWYLAWKDEQGDVFKQLFQAEHHSRFAYSVRPSSNEFFDKLVSYQPDVRPENGLKLAQLISDQPWYFRSWRLDPTIQSVLLMLDAIHKRFASSTGLFGRLLDEAQPAITFQLLDLEHFGLSDDLYIKMNARGTPLTAFETFKARYEQELKKQFEGTTFAINEQSFSATDYVARRLDTTWTDLFWKHRDKSNLYDGALMNIFRAVALVTRSPDNDEYLTDVSILRNELNKLKEPTYTDFHFHAWLDERFTLALIHLLDAWSKEGGKLSTLLPDSRYFDEAAIFNGAASKGANLSYVEVVQFAAYVIFIVKYQGKIDAPAFQEWMRIVCNLSVNTDYNRADDLRRSIVGLHLLLEHAGDMLKHFAETATPARGFNEQQITEEQLKARLILAHSDWRELIDRAEAHGYFRGQIAFLLDFSGASTASTGSEPSCWDLALHTTLEESFSRYYSLADKMFTVQGLRDLGNSRWQRALLTMGNYLLPKGRNYSFLVNASTDEASWKRLLRGTGPNAPEARGLLKKLWEQLSPENPLSEQLDKIIDTPRAIESWREALVYCPSAFDFCHSTFIRWHAKDLIYLLRRARTNGEHAELFTYCLYQRLMSKENTFSVLKSSYETVTDTYTEPHLRLFSQSARKRVAFRVDFRLSQYQIRLNRNEGDDIANLEETLQAIGFVEVAECLQMISSQSDIEGALMNLDQALSSII